MGIKWFTFFLLCHFSWDMKHIIGMRWLAKPSGDFPHTLWSSYKYLVHYQKEDSCAHPNGHKVPPNFQLWLKVETRMVQSF